MLQSKHIFVRKSFFEVKIYGDLWIYFLFPAVKVDLYLSPKTIFNNIFMKETQNIK